MLDHGNGAFYRTATHAITKKICPNLQYYGKVGTVIPCFLKQLLRLVVSKLSLHLIARSENLMWLAEPPSMQVRGSVNTSCLQIVLHY